uniref:Major facilitator superfamily associated domain-containing protein n=1 Tax=Glossina brevipalpis TaxID=37001 RepID=A0A1A9WMC0_9MUSC
MDKFNLSPDEANNVNSVLYLISAVASPLFGFIVDKSGRNVNWIFLAISTTMVAHSILAFTMLNPYVAIVTILSGLIVDKSDGDYMWLEIFYLGWLANCIETNLEHKL